MERERGEPGRWRERRWRRGGEETQGDGERGVGGEERRTRDMEREGRRRRGGPGSSREKGEEDKVGERERGGEEEGNVNEKRAPWERQRLNLKPEAGMEQGKGAS